MVAKDPITIDIIATYQCNYQCDYCFLGKYRNRREVIPPEIISKKLHEISKLKMIREINLYGGEISLLHINYIDEVISILSDYVKPNIITNLSNWNFLEYLNKKNVTISTSLNDERMNNHFLENKLYQTDCSNLSILQVVTPTLLKEDMNILMTRLYLIDSLFSFLRYSPSLNSNIRYHITNRAYADFIKKVIQSFPGRTTNEEELLKCLTGEYDPRMRSHIFLNPEGHWMSVQFDNDLEYFKEYQNLNEWKIDCFREEVEYFTRCSNCKYFGRCYSEHIKVSQDHDECCGLYSLLSWYDDFLKAGTIREIFKK